MAKRKRNSVAVKEDEPKKEENTLPLVRTSDEPVVKKVKHKIQVQILI